MTEIVPAAPGAINEITFQALLPFWANSIAENLSTIRDQKALNITTIPKRKEPCIIIGGGPSLKKLNHLGMIRDSGWKHTVLCCDKELANCLKHDIKPTYIGTVDGSSKINGFYTQGIVRKHASDISAIFPIYTHPSVVNTWQSYHGKIYWFTPIIDLLELPDHKINMHSSTWLLHLLSKGKGMLSGIGNVGSMLWNIAAEIEADPIILVGFDFSEQVIDKADAVWFKQMTAMFLRSGKTEKQAQDKAANLHQPERNPDFISDRDDPPYYTKGEPVGYLINPYWKSYRELFALHIVQSGIHTINATGGGCLHTEAQDNKGNYILKCPNFEAKQLSEVLTQYADVQNSS